MPRKENEALQPLNLVSEQRMEETIRIRAYQLFEQRGRADGNDLDDWLQAEAEVMGRKPVARADLSTVLHEAVA